MFLSETFSGNLGLLEAGVVALLGYAVVFFGLILLMTVVIAMGKYFAKKEAGSKEPKESKVVQEQPAPDAEPVDQPTAPGTAGQLKLHNVEPKTAAMLMAIVANKLGKPLNELRFISIKEVE